MTAASVGFATVSGFVVRVRARSATSIGLAQVSASITFTEGQVFPAGSSGSITQNGDDGHLVTDLTRRITTSTSGYVNRSDVGHLTKASH